MIKKENKIMVVVASTPEERLSSVAKLAVRLKFASINSDAKKIVTRDISTIDLSTSYFVFCSNFNMRTSPSTTQKLIELAARGIAVIVGVKSIQREYEFISQIIYPEDLT